MAKYKLALIGKNITHSKSPEIYNHLLNGQVEYSLIDCDSVGDVPSLDQLKSQFDGVSITSPYKELFVNAVLLDDVAKKVQAINCLSFVGDKIYGYNTDFLAIVEILHEYFEHYKIDRIIILGDGVMSRVTEAALRGYPVTPIILSRKKTINFQSINLTDYLDQEKALVINTCAREFVYVGAVTNQIIFWDYNYNFKPHRENLNSKCIYQDGYKMLELQAEYALQFWSIKKKI